MIGNKYVLKKANRNPWELIAFSGIPVKEGSVITVKGTEHWCGYLGVKKIELLDVEYEIDPDHPNNWCFFTECMANDYDEYGICEFMPELESSSFEDHMKKELGIEENDPLGVAAYKKEIFPNTGLVGVSHCETEYLSQGKNGVRLQESVDRIRTRGITKEKAARISGKTMKAYLDQYGVKSLEERYNEWVLENTHIYELFCKFTKEVIEAGHEKTSHWLIVNRIRWEVEVVTKSLCEEDKEYKISNDYVAFLARDFIKDHPEHEGIFNLKQMKRV